MRIASLRQSDGTTCGPAVAVVAAALLNPGHRPVLAGQARFSDEQIRVHARVNRVWPRRLGMTPAGMVLAITTLADGRGPRYRWRRWRGRHDRLDDVLAAVGAGWPVPMLVGGVIPRHWVLIVSVSGETLQCYEPSSGRVRAVELNAVRHARLAEMGYPRPFAFVLPRPSTRSATA